MTWEEPSCAEITAIISAWNERGKNGAVGLAGRRKRVGLCVDTGLPASSANRQRATDFRPSLEALCSFHSIWWNISWVPAWPWTGFIIDTESDTILVNVCVNTQCSLGAAQHPQVGCDFYLLFWMTVWAHVGTDEAGGLCAGFRQGGQAVKQFTWLPPGAKYKIKWTATWVTGHYGIQAIYFHYSCSPALPSILLGCISQLFRCFEWLC